MAPSIEIDDEIFAFLKENAEPLVDTPATVLRRLLGLESKEAESPEVETKRNPMPASAKSTRGKGRHRKGNRATRGTLLPESEYELPILRYLEQNGGRAPSREVIDGVGIELADQMTDTDREALKSGEIRWKNRAAFVRLRLVEKGELDGKSPRGTWAITTRGSRRLSNSVSG